MPAHEGLGPNRLFFIHCIAGFRQLCLLKTSSAAEILVITDPNADRNEIEI